jgi:mannitol-specific phosphotransferase system IIBC component
MVFFFFFCFGFPPFAIEVATQVKSSIVSFFFFQQILRVQKSRKAKRSREQARTRKEQTNKGEKKSQWKNQETREIAKIINTFVSARGGGGVGNV